MSGTDGESMSPSEAFALVGNETRLEMLRRLWENADPMSFVDLYEPTGLDDTAQFNYHLDKLVDHYVQKTADWYELKNTGRDVMPSILANAPTDNPLSTPVSIVVE